MIDGEFKSWVWAVVLCSATVLLTWMYVTKVLELID
jgi:hypothetical protein